MEWLVVRLEGVSNITWNCFKGGLIGRFDNQKRSDEILSKFLSRDEAKPYDVL